jgi:FdhD protein
MEQSGSADISILKYSDGANSKIKDLVAVEAPLRIMLSIENENGKHTRSVAVTLRTPGQDMPLALGYLFSEGILTKDDSILSVDYSKSDADSIIISMKGSVEKLQAITQRNNAVYAACGICGKTEFEPFTVDDLKPNPAKISLAAEIIVSLTRKMAPFQQLFEKTGGIHAAGIFDKNGDPEIVMEDIGRHNAVDKAIGHFLLRNEFSLSDKILVLSGRAGYELIQKAAMAEIGLVVSVGAPSSMAIDLAKDAGITLVGFVKNDNFNIYTHHQQIIT